jgi:hypothetical protein
MSGAADSVIAVSSPVPLPRGDASALVLATRFGARVMSKPNFEWHDRSCYRVMLEPAVDPRSVRSHSGKKEEKKKRKRTAERRQS